MQEIDIRLELQVIPKILNDVNIWRARSATNQLRYQSRSLEETSQLPQIMHQ